MNTEQLITITMTQEQYDDMVYCMETIRKMRERSKQHYHKYKTNPSRPKRQEIPIPTIPPIPTK